MCNVPIKGSVVVGWYNDADFSSRDHDVVFPPVRTCRDLRARDGLSEVLPWHGIGALARRT